MMSAEDVVDSITVRCDPSIVIETPVVPQDGLQEIVVGA